MHVSAERTGKVRKVKCLGIPVRAVNFGNSHGVLACGPNGAAETFYISYYSSSGSALIGYHAATKKLFETKLDSEGGYGCCVGTDGALYVGGVRPGDLYRHDPMTGEIEALGGSQFGVTYIWDAASSEDGKIYGACHPTCSVLEYDIAAKKLRDLGRVNDSERGARAVCVDHLGKVWVGVGTHAHLVVLDPTTGERVDVLPAEYQANSTCYSLQASGRYVLATVIYDGKMLVFDAETRDIVNVREKPEGAMLWVNVPGARSGEAYFWSTPDNDLYHYSIGNDKLTLAAGNLGQVKLVAGGRYVHGFDDQDYFLYDLKTTRCLDRRRLTRARDGMKIFTLTGGPDGNVYGSAYINQHIFRCDAETGKLADLGKVVRSSGQVDSIHAGRDGKIYLGSYVRAVLSIYDPAKPWNPGREADSNPRELGRVGHGQYRTSAIALGPYGNIWVGTTPCYNSGPTGALTRWNPETGERKTWLDLTREGAILRIAVDERYVYCVGGDLTFCCAAGDVFFVWEPKKERKLFEEARAVFSLVAAPNGKIVGNSGEESFVFDPSEMKITKTFVSPIGQMDYMTVAPNGRIYGINESAIGEIDPETWKGERFANEGGKFLAADGESRLYFARGEKLYRLQ